jgi:hypothetical protein
VGAARQEADAWRCLAHALNVEVRRRLIPLVRANLMPHDLACRVLDDAGLPALPRLWTVRLTPVVRRHTHVTSTEQAITALRHDLDHAISQTFGPPATVTFDQPPQASATGRRERTGRRPYTIHGQPMLVVTVRAETRRQAYVSAGTLLATALRSLPGVEVGDAVAIHVEPDPHGPVELDVDTDAPPLPYTPPPVPAGTLTEARAARQVAKQAWQYQARRIRAALIDALLTADFGDSPGGHGPYGIVNDLLVELGLAGLPHAYRYEITAAIPLTITADTPAAARITAYRLVRDAAATCPQYGLPISTSATFREPDITESGTGGFEVTWYETYLVCLRATHAPRLAEHAVRLQLSVLAETLPHIAEVPLTTAYLGEHIDHRLDPERD